MKLALILIGFVVFILLLVLLVSIHIRNENEETRDADQFRRDSWRYEKGGTD